MGAMTLVELVDSHRGFKVITDLIQTSCKRTLLWIIGFTTFFLSAVLDNLTTTIVMISLLRKIVPESKDRMILGAVIVIAANAGGAIVNTGIYANDVVSRGNLTLNGFSLKLQFDI